jgi:aspartate racemase
MSPHGTIAGMVAATAVDVLPPPRARIGIVTGSGPEAGLDLWAKVLRANRELQGTAYRGDLDAPEVVIHSLPALGLSMELERHDAAVWRALQASARFVGGCTEVWGIACNTLNHYADRLEALGLPSRLVPMADAAAAHLRAQGVARVALLGARPVMALGPWSHYRRLAAQIEVEVPRDLDALHQVIYDIKAVGGDNQAIRRAFDALLADLRADVVLLACTELPLIDATRLHTDKRLVDATELLAQALARAAQQPREPARAAS